ncbi:uncharacterized protein BDZ99DRAFT_520089 [Mytilinidion resinicola]|uniref:Uncharacterized protein n=1 Tax=Mytilinidion resinicola TaxID=574789 RepID=A0A6A6YN82_9PEZI|nr:uncharacterized protein BDZ99DRAFT_520089 [Mytilinidion resinicola]KAF2809998.1 hypothetical protein BDZ99DRAFT_520089 [Mytilinidion resinicola]
MPGIPPWVTQLLWAGHAGRPVCCHPSPRSPLCSSVPGLACAYFHVARLHRWHTVSSSAWGRQRIARLATTGSADSGARARLPGRRCARLGRGREPTVTAGRRPVLGDINNGTPSLGRSSGPLPSSQKLALALPRVFASRVSDPDLPTAPATSPSRVHAHHAAARRLGASPLLR